MVRARSFIKSAFPVAARFTGLSWAPGRTVIAGTPRFLPFTAHPCLRATASRRGLLTTVVRLENSRCNLINEPSRCDLMK